jgi:hypothetical protein
MTSHLVIPDAHAMPNQDLRRFEWLGKYIIEHKPSVIIDIGDWWDMASLCFYDKEKREFHSRSIKEDIESGHEAEKLAFGPIIEYNEKQITGKKKRYHPTIIRVRGNHEYRLKKLLDVNRQLDGVFDYENDFKSRLDLPQIVVPFMDQITIDDIAYSHYFVSGVRATPCSSARQMLNKKHMSCTMGHAHTLETTNDIRADGSRIRSLICGSFHDPDHDCFAGPQVNKIWWNGLIMKHNVNKGNYDLEEISINRLQSMYSKGK